MSIRAEKAVEYKKSYNCAQAVLLSFKKELNKSEDELLALDSGFGAGMGSMEATCGAAIAAGLLNQSNTPTKMMTKEMLIEFKAKAGATICGDSERTHAYRGGSFLLPREQRH